MTYPPIVASQCADQLRHMASDTKSIDQLQCLDYQNMLYFPPPITVSLSAEHFSTFMS